MKDRSTKNEKREEAETDVSDKFGGKSVLVVAS